MTGRPRFTLALAGLLGLWPGEAWSDEAPAAWGFTESMQGHWREITQRVSDKDSGYRFAHLLTHMEHWRRNNPGKDIWKTFFGAAAPKLEDRLYTWAMLDKALAGNDYDKGAEQLKSSLYRLPIEQHYRVAFLFATADILVGKYGTSGHINKARKWLVSSIDYPVYCEEYYQRFERERIALGDYFKGWRSLRLHARVGQSPDHVAPCYSFEADGARVDIVPDPYMGNFSIAALWWMTEDKLMFTALSKLNESRSPKAWCDPKLIEEARKLVKKERLDAPKLKTWGTY